MTPLDPEPILAALADTRARTLELVGGIPTAELEAVQSPLMSPLAWDLGHIAAFEDLWLAHRHGGQPLLRPELAGVYDAFESPRARRGELPYLRAGEARANLEAVRERTLAVARRSGVGDGLLFELVLRHEQQHTETMLQTIELAHLDPGWLPAPAPVPAGAGGEAATGLELVEVPGGPCTLGARAAGFAYDNERPRHRVELPAFRIARTPVTNTAFARFVQDGGYGRREWWSDEGWAWRREHTIERPAQWTADGREWRCGEGLVALAPERPVVHVSWYEADAFARAHGARLPTEAEWEMAATWDPAGGAARPYPWGDEPPDPERATLDQRPLGPGPVTAHPAGAAPMGALAVLGDVWEWTASEFGGYPGFRAHPYREYSEVFFGDGFKVLRGGSWATRARVATPTFRNWDYPRRRQIFAGLRIAQDAGG
jgi:iron(II)-dependent oxidoreductase